MSEAAFKKPIQFQIDESDKMRAAKITLINILLDYISVYIWLKSLTNWARAIYKDNLLGLNHIAKCRGIFICITCTTDVVQQI